MIIGAIILYKNWQQQGAVCNATLDELRSARMATQDNEKNCVISVANHKTGCDAPVKLTLGKVDYNHVQSYLTYVRPLQNPDETSPYIVLFGPKKLTRMAQR